MEQGKEFFPSNSSLAVAGKNSLLSLGEGQGVRGAEPKPPKMDRL
jgi:hypothetical protein